MNRQTRIRKGIELAYPEDVSQATVDKIDTLPYSARKEVVKLLNHLSTKHRPGILDRISTCESREAAHLMWHEFLDSANSVSQKTINKANRLLATLDFPLP